MRKFAVTLILFSAQLLLAAPSANNCRRFFNYPDGTDALISYLESIAEMPSVKPWLVEFYKNASLGNVVNPISTSAARVNVELQIHRAGVNEILENSFFEMQRIKIWVELRLAQISSNAQERNQVQEKTKQSARPIKFVIVNDPQKNPDPVAPKYVLEMMDGPVTQKMWLDIFDSNPSENQSGVEVVDVPVRGNIVQALPDHPVEKITFWSAIIFANEMSKKIGLSEAYDLSGLSFTGAASLGTLRLDKSVEQRLFAENNKETKVIARPGLRLPTQIELEYLLHKRSYINGVPYSDIKENQVLDLFHHILNVSHAVGSMPHIEINNQKIFDLFSNVMFWTTTARMESVRNGSNFKAVTWGNDWNTITANIKRIYSISTNCNDNSWRTGIILVRTVPQ